MLRGIGAPRTPDLGTREKRFRCRAVSLVRDSRMAQQRHIGRWGKHRCRAMRAAPNTAPSTDRNPATRAGAPAPRRTYRQDRAIVGRPQLLRRAPSAPRCAPEASASSRGRAATTRAGGGKILQRRGSPVTSGPTVTPTRSTSLEARLRAAVTVTCWPRIARIASSNPSQAPGVRKPGRMDTNGANAASPERWAPIDATSASRSNRRRSRATIPSSAFTLGKADGRGQMP